MTEPKLVLDFSTTGISLWQPAEADEWTLLGFAGIDDPGLEGKLAEMHAAAVQAAGPDFATTLFLPDDQIAVRHLELNGGDGGAMLEQARLQSGRLAGAAQEIYLIDSGKADGAGLSAVASVARDVIGEAVDFARTYRFNPVLIASRSFVEGYQERAFFDLPPVQAAPPRRAEAQVAVVQSRADGSLPSPSFRPQFPSVSVGRKGLGAIAAAAAVATFGLYWLADPLGQFVRQPQVVKDPGALASSAEILAARNELPLLEPVPRPEIASRWSPTADMAEPDPVAGQADTASPVMVSLGQAPSPGPESVGIAPVMSSLGDAFMAPAVPAGLAIQEAGGEPVAFGIAAQQVLPELVAVAAADSSQMALADLDLVSVSSRSTAGLETVVQLSGEADFLFDLPEFAYRNGTVAINEPVAPDAGAAPDLSVPDASGQMRTAALQINMPPAGGTADIPPATALPPAAMPGDRPKPRPDAIELITPAEAAAALTPAVTGSAVGPEFGPEFWPAFGPEFDPAISTDLGPAFGPNWAGAPVDTQADVAFIEFDTDDETHIRPLPRPASIVAASAAEAAQEQIAALNLSPEANLDVGLGWQEYNPDNPAHVRPKSRPASLQQLAESGDLAPTRLAVRSASRPAPRPGNIAEIALANAARMKAEKEAAAAAEAQAIAVAAATVQAETTVAATTPEEPLEGGLAELIDNEPDADVQVASLPTSASVQKAATIEGHLDRGEMNLIGIYGSQSSRRALVRLPSGRYERVTVGDSVGGWKVSAIGDDAIRINKSGKEAILRMPE